jgi:hypothetical protein
LLIVEETTEPNITPVPGPDCPDPNCIARLFRVISVRTAKLWPCAQTPKPKFTSDPFLTVIGYEFDPPVPAKPPIPTPTLSPPAPVRVKPFRSRITGPAIAVEIVMAPTFVVAEKVRFPSHDIRAGGRDGKG